MRHFVFGRSRSVHATLALDRLNLARRRRSPGDQAIDSSICLEALLGDKSSQELTYRLRLRAALLLGTTLAERQEIRQAVRNLYDLRSSVVHGRGPKDTLHDAQHASRGLEICTQAARAIVQLNALPDFPTWELTGRPRDNDGVWAVASGAQAAADRPDDEGSA